MRNRIDYFANLISIIGSHSSKTVGRVDPTCVDTYVGYLTLGQGFETPEAGKHEGEKCVDCGSVVKDDRCFCTDYGFALPNNYEVTITIPCWVTEVRIKARTGEEYLFIWDNESRWCSGNADLAEKMLDTFLSCADVIDRDKFLADPTEGEPDFDRIF
ncbi:hypothetical protein [Oryzomonas rubra]|uniref:Uncharacterized protein n=1 Tax=Oryzomonas rubra TaxID=2509454 RepID=A0A5A9X707_9BACT|nr:hypothetical protein [Oryzomonas rubra]KAA0888750.1 hypothetical protein ET418_15330 [Oryzomonas rubra]